MADDETNPGSASGSASPAPAVSPRRVLDRLGEAECMELLAGGRMGRLVFTSRYGLTALPVSYKIDGASLVLGTWDPVFDEDLRTGIEHADYQVAVEADQTDLDAREGWIVLVRGAAHHLDTEAERAPFIDAGLGPWLDDVPVHFIRVEPTTIFGVRVHRACPSGKRTRAAHRVSLPTRLPRTADRCFLRCRPITGRGGVLPSETRPGCRGAS